MDVTCERCGTEYEFDETLVSDRGTTVKCTNCGHLFKVFRGGGAAPVAAPPDDKKTWTLRTGSESRPIQSLKELQRLISEGQVGEDDELSRSGEAWKRLGDIAELQTFFAAARAAATASPPRRDATARGLPRPPADVGPARVAPVRPGGKGTMMGMGGKPAAPAPSFGDDDPNKRTHKMAVPPPAAPPPRRPPPPAPEPEYAAPPSEPPPRRDPTPAPRRDNTPHVVQTARNAPPAPPAPPPERRDATPSTAPPVRARDIHPTREAETERMPAPPRPRSIESRRDDPDSVRPEPRGKPRRALSDPPPRLRVDDEDDAPTPAPRRSSSGLWVGLLVLVAAVAGVALGWDRIQAMMAPAEDGGATFLAAGDEAVARDRDEGYRDAIGEYTKALALDDHDVRALVGLSRAHALLAQNRLFLASDLDARAGEDAALHGEASALRREATELTTAARENAEQAVRGGTGGADAEVVLADALRLSADPLARSRLDRARTLEPTPTAEALRVDALLTAEGSSLAQAVPLAEQAVAEDPGLLRARILLARAHLAAGDPTAARAQLQAVLTRDAEHPIARALLERLDAGGTDAGVAVAVAPPTTGGSTGSTGTSGGTSAGPSAGSTASTGSTGSTGSAGPTTGSSGPSTGGARSYEALITQAREILDNGNPSRARALYDQALAARPGGPEALTGLGFCLLAGGDANGALSRFRTAAATGFSEALIGMGDAYRRLGDNDRALEAYDQYLTRSPSGPHASIARRQADRLRASGAHGGTEGSSGSSGSTGSTGSTGAPETAPHELPAPTGTTEPPPSDTPAIDSEP